MKTAMVLATLLLFTQIASAQLATTVTKNPLGTRVVDAKASQALVEQLLQQSGYEYRRVGDVVWIIKGHGANFTDFQIIIASGTGWVLAGVVVAQKNRVRVTGELSFNLLRLAHNLDYIKVGFDDDGDLFVRTELRLNSLEVEGFKDSIVRVTNAADKAYAISKPFLKSP